MHDTLTLIVVLLGSAVAAVVLFRRLGMPPILAYLLSGLAAGPFGFGWKGSSIWRNSASFSCCLPWAWSFPFPVY